ncbi:hypothetical protein Poly24_25540 [Rosistilla carotiformis]|uniref:DNA-binding protein n=1 Tax=Rosistilla carotiformis TaxID=2528017 RepID=A0A518JTG8_9BACT|nr:hypothetical protein Poly24_25540 [Rosistilla carotiformis]
MSGDKKITNGDQCPHPHAPNQRLASDAQTDSIKANFPKGIARPALRALVAAKLPSMDQLTTITEHELSQLHGMGPKAVNILRASLEAAGLGFRDPTE